MLCLGKEGIRLGHVKIYYVFLCLLDQLMRRCVLVKKEAEFVTLQPAMYLYAPSSACFYHSVNDDKNNFRSS